jgi:pimeloyl-ACP methyl ester carboxylesterase
MNLEEFNQHRRVVETELGEFAYVDVGEGPPAVFVHGVFVSAYVWRHVIDQLRDERRCVAYNLPGHGGSHVPRDQDLSLAAQGEMLEAFCEALDLEEIDLVANDTGGAVAQVFAVRRPDLLRTLTLTNCEAHDILPSPDPLPNLALGMAERGELAPLLAQQGRSLEFARGELGLGVGFEHPEHLTAEDIRGYLEPHFSTVENAREIERTLLSLNHEHLLAIEPELKKLEVPTLIVWGTGDRFFELKWAHWLRDTIPGAREVVEIEGGKLFWPGERGEELVPHLREHWAAATVTGATEADTDDAQKARI